VVGFACPSASSRDYEFHGHQGALLDPRLDILCRDRKGRALAYAWVDPAAGVRWIGVDQGSYTEVYEVLARLPVRIASIRGIQAGRARRAAVRR